MTITAISLFMHWTEMKISAKSVLSALELKTYESVYCIVEILVFGTTFLSVKHRI